MINLLNGRRYVLSFEEKHWTRHFVILNYSELEAAALKVLSERFKEGYWYGQSKNEPPRPSYTKEQIEDLKGPAKVAATKEYASYKQNFKTWKDESDLWNKIQTAISTKNGSLAYEILEQRSDYEYERMALNLAEEC